MLLPVIFSLITILLVGMGTYIWKAQAVWLLSNFSEADIRNKVGMAKWAGLCLYLFATFFLAFGCGIYLLRGTLYEIVPIFILIPSMLVVTIIYLVGGQRFLHKGFKNHNSNGRIDL